MARGVCEKVDASRRGGQVKGSVRFAPSLLAFRPERSHAWKRQEGRVEDVAADHVFQLGTSTTGGTV